MILEPKNLNSIDEDIAKMKMNDIKQDIEYHREPFSRHLVNILIVLSILAVLGVIFIVLR